MMMETQGYVVVIDDRNDDALSSYRRRNGSQQRPRQSMESRARKAVRHSVAWRFSPPIPGDVADVFAAETPFDSFVLCAETGSSRRSAKRGRRARQEPQGINPRSLNLSRLWRPFLRLTVQKVLPSLSG